jgi:hypothetical protein
MTEPRTFKPAIHEGRILAGGLAIAEVTPDGRLVFDDGYRDRCRARGTPDVPVDVCELVECVLAFLRENGGL